jgi:hypothetical protein
MKSRKNPSKPARRTTCRKSGGIYLSLETAVWAAGGGGRARTPAVPAGKRQAQEGLSGTRSRSGSHEGTAGKKVVSPRARRQAAHAACARGLRTRRAAWLCPTARSGIGYEGKRPKREARLAKALRGAAKRYPQWGYRLAGRFLRQHGWRVNLKRVHRVWRQCGFQVPIRRPRKKVMTGATLQPLAKAKHDVWSWDFVHDATSTGEPLRCLTVQDEATRWVFGH